MRPIKKAPRRRSTRTATQITMTVRSLEQEGPYAKAVFEWLLAVAPVAVYVTAEHMFVSSKGHASVFDSAEWGIASSFLCILMIYLLLLDLPRLSTAKRPVKVGPCRITAFLLFMLLLGSIAVSIAILRIPEANEATGRLDTRLLYALHWSIFAGSSVAFVFLKSLAERLIEHHDRE
jgi:hypothetical protein